MNIFSSSHRETSPRSHRSSEGHTSPRRLPAPRVESEPASEDSFTAALMAALFALPITAIIGLIFLLIVTAVAYGSPDPDALTTPLSLSVLGLTSLLGGLVASRRRGTRPILCGLLLGLLWTLLLWAVSLLFGDEARSQLTLGFPAPALWGLHGGAVLISMLGGKLGGRRAVRAQKPHHTKRS